MATTEEKRIMDVLVCSTDEAREVVEVMKTFGMDKILESGPQWKWIKEARVALRAVRAERRDLMSSGAGA